MRIRDTLSATTLASAVVLAACGGGGEGNDLSKKLHAIDTAAKQAGEPTSSSPLFPPSTEGRMARGKAIGKIRVINTIAVNGAPGPAMDVYDISRPDSSTKPLITNLQYGQVSEYVTPHGWTAGDTRSNLYVLPAGSIKPSGPLQGGNIDNSGFTDGDQLTLALFGSELGFGIGQIAEAGSRVRPGMGMDPTPPAGKGLLLVRESVSRVPNEPEPVMYLSIDGTCPNVGGGAEGRYPVAPGDHTLALVTSPPGHGLTQAMCAEKAPVASISAHVDAGQRIDVIVYGPSAALKLLATPVAN